MNAPLSLQLLVGFDVRNPSGASIESFVSQPKVVALLAYLAIEAQRGLQRRDKLLALLWPDLPAPEARHALRQALYVLGGALGDGVLVRRGANEVGVDSARLRCDAVLFETAFDEGRYEDAVHLYRGDLLEGFHLTGAPGFQDWLDAERSRLRRLAADAAYRLSEESQERSDPGGAILAVRRALELAPYNENALRQLMLLLSSSGDRAAALTEYENFRQRLQTHLELSPTSDTEELAKAIRAPPTRRAPGLENDVQAMTNEGSLDVPAHAGKGTDSPTAAGSGSVPSRRAGGDVESTGTPRRRLLWSALLGGAVALAVLLAMVMLRTGRAGGATTPDIVLAIFPFAVRGDSAVNYLQEGALDLLSAKVNSSVRLRTVDTRVLLQAVRDEPPLGPSEAARYARRLGADFFVLGSVTATPDRVLISAGLYDPERNPASVAGGSVSGGYEEIAGSFDQLAVELLTALVGTDAGSLATIASLTTESPEALQAFLDGERYRREDWFRNRPGPDRLERAVAAFQSAVGYDSAFALAWLALAEAAMSNTQHDLAREAVAAALRPGGRLPSRIRMTGQALAAHLAGDGPRAERLYRTVLATHPDDAIAWEGLSETLVHHNALQGRSIREARDPLLKVLEYGPRRPDLAAHLAQIALVEQDWDAAESALSSGYRGQIPVQWALPLALGRGESATAADLVHVIERGHPVSALATSAYVATYIGDLGVARRLARFAMDSAESPAWRATAHLQLASLHLQGGQPQAARHVLEDASAIDEAGSDMLGGLFAVLHSLFLGETTWVAHASSRLSSSDSGSSLTPVDWLLNSRHRGAEVAVQAYLRVLLAVHEGREAEWVDQENELRGLVDTSQIGLLAEDMLLTLEAERLRLQGNVDGALATLRRQNLLAGVDRHASPFFSRAYERFLRGELLRQLERPQEAYRWYDSFGQNELLYELPFLGLATLRKAEIHETLRQRAQAVLAYRKFVKMWEDAEPELRYLLDTAQARLRALEASLPPGTDG